MDKICKTPDCIRNPAGQLLNASDKNIMTISHVKAYLESTQGQNALEACHGGSVIPNIKLDLLKKLQIPMVSIEK